MKKIHTSQNPPATATPAEARRAEASLVLGGSEEAHVEAAQAFAALGSEARLEIVRVLVRAGPSGLTVGALQERLGTPASTLSHHLKFLVSCGLVGQARAGRLLICTADFDRIGALAGYLTRECCIDASQTGVRDAEDDRSLS